MNGLRHRSKAKNGSVLPSRKVQDSFTLKIHRSLHPVLDRIRVPEPRPFVPDPFQTEALEVLGRADVLVTAPTGAGKTYIAIEAIRRTYRENGSSWYASPLKALSNAKYEEFSLLFGAENVGILTGDRKENPQAPIIVGTTEILRNQLYDAMHRGEDLDVDLVVLDEAHYLGDEDRGVVWEEVLIYLPSRVRLLLLSATIQNAGEICSWLQWLRGVPCEWVAAFERPVPLYPLFLFPNGELSPLSTRRGMYAKIRTVETKSLSRRELPNIARIMEALRQANLLPAIFFLKSRADCEKAISLCAVHAKDKTSSRRDGFHSRLNSLLKQYPFMRQHQHLGILKASRVGAHHGGQLPHWKLLLEKLMQEGSLDAIFSTSTVAAGVNFPARTVVIFQSDRFNGRDFVDLTATDLLQMTGRAGRRGMDEIGFVLVLPGPYQNPQLIHDLLRSPPDPIISQIRVNFSMVLNLLLSHKREEIKELFASSLATFQNIKQDVQISAEFELAEKDLEQWVPEMACGSIERLVDIRPLYAALCEQIKKARKLWKKQASVDTFYGSLTPGRLFYSRRGTPYVVIAPQVERQSVVSVRLAHPLRSRRGRVRTYSVDFKRIHSLGERLGVIPSLNRKKDWEALIAQYSPKSPQPDDRKGGGRRSSALENTAGELACLLDRKASLPCDACRLYAACQKSISHPFADLLQRYLEYRGKFHTIQEELWRSFLRHYEILGEEGYVDNDGNLTPDGLWACKLRLDQPLLISDGIRKGVFPHDDPEMLAALIAPFVMDRERHGDIQLPSLLWKHPELAKPFFKMLQNLQPLRDQLKAAGFPTPPLAFWTVVTVSHWARGATWESVREISGMDEGDLAMVILRTADHLRQIESLSETHPRLAQSARRAIELILREPVLVE